MRVTFLGTGSAFTVGGNFNSNVLVRAPNGRALLIDAGTDLRHSLHAQGLGYADINTVYVSHLHSDHVGGLEYLGLSTRFDPRTERPRLLIHGDISARLWNHCLRGGMEEVETGRGGIEDYFEVQPLTDSFEWEGVRFEIVATPHVRYGEQVMYSYGLRAELGGERVWLTTDTRFEPELMARHYEESTLIFHDCETAQFPSGVHSHYDQLCGLPEATRAKMWLYHYQPGALPEAQARGFRGFVECGQSFDFSS